LHFQKKTLYHSKEIMPSKISTHHFHRRPKNPDIRFWIGSVGFFTLGSRALAVVIGFQIYKITHSALALGWLGLVEAIPALSLVLIGGYVADHFSRRKILLITRGSSCICAWPWLPYPCKAMPTL
jgi:hypothetical protein